MCSVKILFVIFIFTICKTVYADICVEEKITTNLTDKIFNGIKKTFITKNKTLLDDPTISKKVIYDYENNKVYLIDDLKKDVSIYPLNDFTLPFNDKIYSNFVSVKEEDILSRESSIKKKIGQYDCYGVVIYMPKIAALATVWITKGIETPLASFFSFIEKNNDILIKKLIPSMKESNAYIVESEIIIVRQNETEKYLRTELIKISTQNVPENLFKLPEDYRKLNMDSAPSPK
jgi:hypothetical protein